RWFALSSLTSEPHQGKKVLSSAAQHHGHQAAWLRCWTSGRGDGRAPRRRSWSRGRVPGGALRRELVAADRHSPSHVKEPQMPELVIDFITSHDAHSAAAVSP